MYDSTTIFALTHRVSHIALSREGGPSASGFDPAEPARSYRVGRLPFTAYRSRAARSHSVTPTRCPHARARGGGAPMMALAARCELRGGARQHSRFNNCGEGGSMSSSLSRFSGWRSRSLSLGEGLTDSTGARDGTRADGVLIEGGADFFLFSSPSGL